MGGLLRESGIALPLQQHVVVCLVECPLDERRMAVLTDDDRLVSLWLCPVVAIVGVLARRVGEPEGDGGPLVFQEAGLDPGIDRILGRMDTSSHFHWLTIGFKG